MTYQIQVALARPLYPLFSYLSDEAMASGVRVRVPFGKGNTPIVGMVIESKVLDEANPSLKNVLEVLDDSPIIDTHLLSFLRYVTKYYQYPLGMVIQSALPSLLGKGRVLHAQEKWMYQISDEGQRALNQARIGKRQRLILQTAALHSLHSDNVQDFSIQPRELQNMQDRGWLKAQILPFDLSVVEKEGITLNEAQQSVYETLRQLAQFSVAVIDGVTGSGKTEVYWQFLLDKIQQGGQVLLLAPEIGIVESLYQRLKERFSLSAGRYHSGMTDKARLDTWQAVKEGRISLMIGTRSAIFLPFKNLQTIVVDEAHDPSYKQQEDLRYHARDMAIMRAKMLDIPIVLGSATHDLAVWKNVWDGKWSVHYLHERALSSTPNRLTIDDTRFQPLFDGLSQGLINAIHRQLRDKHQVMVFLNRRGYAPLLRCEDCHSQCECPACDKPMTVHIDRRLLICHHCARCLPIPSRCPACSGGNLKLIGMGTQRLEASLAKQFPKARILRIDTDAYPTHKQFMQALEKVREQEVDILLGTQWLAKGHHFPNLHLVAMVDVDRALYGSDYRSEERLAQMLVQVGGRAGRERKGHIWIQTEHPEHPVFSVLNTPYEESAKRMAIIREMADLPPYSAQVLLFARGKDEGRVQEALNRTKTALEDKIQDWQFYGPIPSVLARKNYQYRQHLLLQAKDKYTLQRQLLMVRQWLFAQANALGVRAGMDIDPLWFE